jgi:hypothetical protein
VPLPSPGPPPWTVKRSGDEDQASIERQHDGNVVVGWKVRREGPDEPLERPRESPVRRAAPGGLYGALARTNFRVGSGARYSWRKIRRNTSFPPVMKLEVSPETILSSSHPWWGYSLIFS